MKPGNLKEVVGKTFWKEGKKVCEHLAEVVEGIVRSGSANTAQIARQMSAGTGQGFKTKEMSLFWFLQDEQVQIEDRFWRGHTKLVFELMKERKLVREGEKIALTVDFTTCNRDFLRGCRRLASHLRRIDGIKAV